MTEPAPETTRTQPWSLLSESLALLTLCVAVLFFAVIAFRFFLYCKLSVAFFLAAGSALACFVQLLVFWPERWARMFSFAGEPLLAERFQRWSLSVWQKFVGNAGLGTTSKLAALAELYLRQRRLDDAEPLLQTVLFRLPKGNFAFFSRAESSLKCYLQFLKAAGRESDSAPVSSALLRLRRQTWAAKFLFVLMPLPVVVYLSATEVLNRGVWAQLPHGNPEIVRRNVKLIAGLDTVFFGAGAGAKVYYDYALNLRYSTVNELNALWFARAGLMDLQQAPSPYLRSKLYAIIGNLCLERDQTEQALDAFKRVLEMDAAALPGDRFQGSDLRHVNAAAVYLADAAAQQGKTAAAEALYERALNILTVAGECDSDEVIDLLDKISSLQSARGACAEAAVKKQQICDLLARRLAQVDPPTMNLKQAQEHRRLTREMEACSALLKQSGRAREAAELTVKAGKIRQERVRPLALDLHQQSEIVDATTRTTRLLLDIKYKSAGWQTSLDLLRERELKNDRMCGAMQSLSWFSPEKDNLRLSRRKLEIDMSSMRVRNFPEPDTLAVDVRGTVRILEPTGTRSTNNETFAFAYLLKRSPLGPPVIEEVAEN